MSSCKQRGMSKNAGIAPYHFNQIVHLQFLKIYLVPHLRVESQKTRRFTIESAIP